MNIEPSKLFGKLLHAVAFGALFCSLLTFTPLGNLFFRPVDCWDSQDNFWFSSHQYGLIFSATLAFFVRSVMEIRGWRGFLATFAVAFLCFQFFSLAAIYDVIYVRHCYFPQSDFIEILKAHWKSFLLISLINSACATIFCVPPLVIYKRLSASFLRERDDFLKLDPGAK